MATNNHLKLSRFPNINVINPDDIRIVGNGEEIITPEYLKLEGIEILRGHFATNMQELTKIMVRVETKSHMRMILDNIHIMHIYSPLFVNFIG